MKSLTSLFLLIPFFLISQSDVSEEWIFQTESAINIDNKNSDYLLKGFQVLCKDLNIYMINCSEKDIAKTRLAIQEKYPTKYFFQNQQLEKRTLPPNDLFYSEQYNLDLIEAEKIWQETTGGFMINGEEIVISVLDDGFDVEHDDLKNNYWTNAAEIAGNDIDDDGNGFIDDIMGVNISNGTSDHSQVKHGTEVIGILGAETDNGVGIAGIAFDTKMMIISGVTNVGMIIKGLDYTYEMKKLYNESNGQRGANIVVNNFSGGLKNRFPDDFPSWCELYDLLGEEGILSVGAAPNEDFDVEEDGDLPTLCPSEYLIIVSNSDANDQKVAKAADNQTHVDIFAPGEEL